MFYYCYYYTFCALRNSLHCNKIHSNTLFTANTKLVPKNDYTTCTTRYYTRLHLLVVASKRNNNKLFLCSHMSWLTLSLVYAAQPLTYMSLVVVPNHHKRPCLSVAVPPSSLQTYRQHLFIHDHS